MTRPLTFVSWNLHGIPFTADPSARFARIAARVRRMEPAPDLLLFQEVWGGSLADQLREELPAWEAPRGPGRNWIDQRPGGLIAFARRDGPWRIADVAFHEFDDHAPWWRVWEGDGLSHKGVQQLRLADPLSPADPDAELVVLHTHLQATYGRPEYRPIVRAQLDQLTALARELGGARPIVAAGDLNTPADTPGYLGIRERWRDLTAELRARCGCGTSVREDDAPHTPPKWIDYVLAYDVPGFRVDAELELIANRAPDDPYSDHDGLRGTLRISRAPGAAAALSWALAATLLGAGPLRRRELLRGAAGALLGARLLL